MEGNQDGGVRECGAHLPLTSTLKIQPHVEQFSQENNWKLTEEVL